MALTLFGFPGSTYTRSARLALSEKGVAYTLTPARLGTSEYGAMHPWHKMPVLDHDGFRVFESIAVMRYIDEAFDGPALQPADARGRARMTQWMSAYNDYVAPKAVRGVLVPRFVLAARGMAVDDEAVAKAAAGALRSLEHFDNVLADSPYLAGEQPTLADWLLLPTVAADSALPEADRYTTGLSRLHDWLRRMAARPSFAATAPA